MNRDDDFSSRAEAFEAFDDIPLNTALDNTIGAVIARRYGRREVIRGLLGVTALTAFTGPLAHPALAGSGDGDGEPGFTFAELDAGIDETHHVADGYSADILIRWGDPLFPDSPPFDPRAQSAEAQLKQFGYNNDFLAFMPLVGGRDRALLCVNHEYTNEEVMFPGLGRQDKIGFTSMTPELVEIEMAAIGGTVVEIAREGGQWRVDRNSPYNRRISALRTEMAVDGPAAGHERLKTRGDPSGRRILGTVNNCAGGHTPWGSYLMAEENFHGYFWTDRQDAEGRPEEGVGGDQAKSYARYGVPGHWQAWGKFVDRFNVDKEPNEPNRFGWVVEVDPLNPSSTPVKHTALGRFRHEGAESVVNRDGHVVLYMGDDARFDYVYRFVTKDRYRPSDRAANFKLLTEGTLSVAVFHDDGRLEWRDLVFGQGPLTPDNGFHSQADVVIDARLAADLLGATPMDRPEDVQPSPRTGTVYVMLTNNTKRKMGQEDKANPRPDNAFGHIIEMIPPDGDHAATDYRWDILVKCGDRSIAEVGALWNPATSENGWFASPDNCAFDAAGRLWIATDQGKNWHRTGKADGLYGLGTEGKTRGLSKLFFRCPAGAELCGPCFTPDGNALFLAVQHPATDGAKHYKGFERASTFEDPMTRWPDFQDGMPPRPSVVVVTKTGGGTIG